MQPPERNLMNARFVYAALAATIFLFQSLPVRATCVIAPDGKSINVVTDNGSSDEKTCQVSCKVDTKIGVVSVGCGGNTPPLAKDHSLCAFDKTEIWYKKVVSSEDSCKAGAAGAAPAVVAPAADAKADGFNCRISPDGKTVDAMIANPYKGETSCQMDCKVSTTKAGTTVSMSCSKQVAAGVGQVVLCSHSVDEGKAVKMLSGRGDCVKPLEERTDSEKASDKAAQDSEEAEAQKLANQPMAVPSAANKADEDELEKIGGDSEKLQDFMQKKMDAAMQKALGK
jgi:hypothetical protein